MARRFLDSFDYYGDHNEDVTSKVLAGRYNSVAAGPSLNTISSSPAPRTGRMCLKLGASDMHLERLESGSPATLIVGTGWWFGGAAAEALFFDAAYNSGGGSTNHVRFYRMTDNSIQARHGSGSPVLGTTAASVITMQNWNYVEIKVTVDDTAGVVVVRVNKNEVLNLTGIDTRNGASAIWNSVVWVKRVNNVYIDDVYIVDDTGGVNNDFLDPIQVLTRKATTAGDSAQWTPSGAATNHEAVDEDAVDGDTTHNASSTPGEKDLFNAEDTSAGITDIYWVDLVNYGRREAGGTNDVKNVFKLGGTELASAALTLTTSYTFVTAGSETKPGGGSWTPSDWDSTQIGYELT